MNIDKYLETLRECKPLDERDVRLLCQKAKEILMKEPNVKQVRAPVTVCGDIHGQMYDLLELFQIGGKPPNTNYLFLGDYVDRGFNSVQVFTFVLAMKVKHKDRITILREIMDFMMSVLENIQMKVYGSCLLIFSNICHQPQQQKDNSFVYMEDCHRNLIKQIKQNILIEFNKYHILEQCVIYYGQILMTTINKVLALLQGELVLFGEMILKMVCRAHQLMQKGYQYCHKNKCITIFSAPNYCCRCGNQASIVQIDDGLNINIQQYDPAPRDTQPQVTRRIPQYFL